MKTIDRRQRLRTGSLGALTLVIALCFGGPALAQDEGHFVDLMQNYLDLVDQVVDTAERPEAASMLAIEGIFEIYEKRRDAKGAITHFEGLLARHSSNRAVRNMIRMKLRDIYKEIGELDKALEQLDLILAENLAD